MMIKKKLQELLQPLDRFGEGDFTSDQIKLYNAISGLLQHCIAECDLYDLQREHQREELYDAYKEKQKKLLLIFLRDLTISMDENFCIEDMNPDIKKFVDNWVEGHFLSEGSW